MMKKLLLAAAIALGLVGSASAQTAYQVRDGNGALINMGGQTSSGVVYPGNVCTVWYNNGPLTCRAVDIYGDLGVIIENVSPISVSAGITTPPDVINSSSINSAVSNATYAVSLSHGEATTSFVVTGLTAAGATLTVEQSSDGGTTWSGVSELMSGGALTSSITADGQFRFNTAGRTNIRLRVSATGTGTITVTSNTSSATGAVKFSDPLPPFLSGYNVPITAGSGANIALETGGNLAATASSAANTATNTGTTATNTGTTATNTGTTATNTGTTATEIGATSSPAAGSVNAQLASTVTNTSNIATNTSSTATNTATTNTDFGAPGATACASDTASCSLNQQMQRLAQRITSLITALGSPAQASGSTITNNPAATTTGGCTPYHLAGGTAASTNSTSISSGAHTLCALRAINTTATLVYLRVYDSSSAPTCSSATNLKHTYPIPANSNGAGFMDAEGAFGEAYSNGLGFCVTGGGSDTDNTNAVTGVYIEASYK